MRIAKLAVRMAALIALTLLFQGCVSQDKYDELMQLNKKRGDLIATHEDRIRELEAKNAELEQKLRESDAIAEALDSELKSERQKAQAESARAKELTRKLEALAKKFEGEVVQTPRGPAYRIKGRVLFDSGKADLKEGGKELLKGLSDVLTDGEEDIEVHGHTDTDPILYSGWLSNHHLSVARALSVFKFLKEQNISDKRMMVAGFGPNRPVAPNDTSANKRKNRRVEVLIVTRRERGSGGDRSKAGAGPKRTTTRVRKGTAVIKRKEDSKTAEPGGAGDDGQTGAEEAPEK